MPEIGAKRHHQPCPPTKVRFARLWSKTPGFLRLLGSFGFFAQLDRAMRGRAGSGTAISQDY
jgi:hypothetical protein